MTKEDSRVRQLRSDDDFEQIRNLLLATKKRNYNDLRLNVVNAENLKQTYTESQTGSGTGFVAEQDGQILGFMGVVLPNASQNGLLEYAVADDDSPALEQLLAACTEVVRNSGGQKLFYFATTSFGQIRNKQITMLERMGFVSDEYSHVSTHLSLNEWIPPERLDATGIVPDVTMDTMDIYKLLIEDGEEQQAELFKNQYPDRQPNIVILTFLNEDHKLAGFANYKVNPIGTEISAVAFGLHFSHGCNVSKEDKRRLIQAALLSMKQLKVSRVHSYLTLKNFDTFAIMVREGFDDYLANSLRLEKRI